MRGNPAFVRLWSAQLVSFAGDWINFVALVSILLELTHQGKAVGYLIVANTLPWVFLAPLAGSVADRYDRRTVMIAADLSRALLVLGYLLIAPTGQAWIAYPLTALIVIVAAFFGPASSAAIPNIVTPTQLTAANALSSASWGTMLAVGSALGGLVAHSLGRQAAFVLDSASFVLSAMLIASVRVPFAGRHHGGHEDAPAAAERGPWATLHEFAEALRYAWRHRSILAALLVKTCWGVGGGIIALLSVIPIQVLHRGDIGVATLYASRGLGAVCGPLISHRLAGSPRATALLAAGGVVLCGLFYTGFAVSPTLEVAAGFVFFAHLGGGAQWVLSSALLQRLAHDRILGRIAALDMAGITLTMTISTLLCGYGIDTIGPRRVGVLAGAAVAVLGGLWLFWYGLLRPERFEEQDLA